jgi:HK97 family phage portal protein
MYDPIVPLLPRLRDLFAPSADTTAPPAAPVRVGGRPVGPRTGERRSLYSLGEPLAISVWGDAPNGSGEVVSEGTVTGLSAVWRSCNLIAGSIGTLPLRTLVTKTDGTRDRSASWLDDPGAVTGLTPFGWKEVALWHLLLGGNAFGQHIYGGAGQLVGLNWVHPSAVEVKLDGAAPRGRRFTVRIPGAPPLHLDGGSMTQIMGPSTDGVRGMSVIEVARTSLGTALAGDRGAASAFANGATVAGLVTPEDDLDPDETDQIRDQVNARTTGPGNAAQIAVVNRRLKFAPWTMTAADRQFLESRQFQVEEISRWFGVPPHLLSQTEKQTSWGSGITEQNRGLSRYTLAPWTTRIEQTLRPLVPRTRTVEFDYSAFLQPSPEDEITLLLAQVAGGLMTPNEARRRRNEPPIAGGDTLRTPAGSAPPADVSRETGAPTSE